MRRRLEQHRGDLLVAGYAAISQVELHVWHPDASPVHRLLPLAAVLVLVARNRLPLLAPLLCAAGGMATGLLGTGDDTGIGIVTAGIAGALLGRQGRAGVPALAGLLALVVASLAVDVEQQSDFLTAPLLVVGVAAVSAALFRASRQVAEVRSAIAGIEARSRDERAALLSGERRRVARELHDVVSHHLTVAALQASGARVQLAAHGSTQTAAEALRAAEHAGRQALTDLRPLLDVVGGDGGLAPTPGLADLPQLFDQVRHAGLVVHAEGPPYPQPELPAGHGLVAYRVLQEALTNAVRHGRHRVDVRLDVRDAQLVIDVANDVGGGPSTAGGGHGLVGMRERLALYGGRLVAGRQGSRWALHAELPLRLDEPVPA